MTRTHGFLLCADVGTTSLKAGIFDVSGKAVCASRQQLDISDPSRAAESWLPALLRAAGAMRDELSARWNADGGGNSPLSADGLLSVCALSISGNGPTVVSESGRTLLWNAPLSADITAALPKTKSLFVPRLAAFKALHPDDWRNSARIFSGAEWLVFQLTGSAATVLPEARYEEAYWRREDLDASGIEAKKLPGFVPVGWNAGAVLPGRRAQL
ncbi:MAG: hypothetical protein K2H09_00250, partial [Treponemataceae bacterium]|nr:hypothetical protein [Treponemataceae bacterium]